MLTMMMMMGLCHAEAPPIQVKIVPARVDAIAEHTGPYNGLKKRYDDAIVWSGSLGWHAVAGGSSILYYDTTQVAPHLLRSEARVPLNIYGRVLPNPEAGEENIYLEKSEAMLVISRLHTGPYDEMIPGYSILHRELTSRRLIATGTSREYHLNTPQSVSSEDEQLTEVQLIVEPQGKVDVGLYVGDGGYSTGVVAASLAFSTAGFSIRPISPEQINEGKLDKLAHVLYMPGGWAEPYVTDIDENGAAHIEDFIEEGGGYIGICAGSYYAGKQITWEGELLDYDIDLFPGVPTGPILPIKAWPGYTLATITLDNNHPITSGQPTALETLYYGGPAFTAEGDAEVFNIAQFDQTGDAAIVAFEHGEGKVFLSSVHLEYDMTSENDDTNWPENEKGFDDPESDWPLLQSATKWLLEK